MEATRLAHRGPARTNLAAAMALVRRYISGQGVSALEAGAAFSVVEAYLGKGMKMGEVMKTLGVKSPTTIKKWIALGRFPHAYVVNGQWRIPAADVMLVQEAGMQAERQAMLAGPEPMDEYEGDPFADIVV